MSSKPIFNAGTERFVRDWRSAVVTVTVRDQRYREHDPILGVVPLKLTDILQNSSQSTRWYPLDGGVGFGRIRISLLLRHVETKLPPQMLGWDVGTFEFTSKKLIAEGFNHYCKIKLRTGGSSGKLPRHGCHLENSSATFDLTSKTAQRHRLRLPVKHRYRSPVVFELHTQGKHHAAGFAVFWLQHLIDNEDTPMDIPIWSTKKGARLTQNYITETNWKAKKVPGLEDLTEIGRLKFSGHFSPGIDESHEQFVVDNNTRETYESWEACVAEGVRTGNVIAEVPEEVEQLHERSLLDGRDVLKHADPKERKRWIDKQGIDWSGAFGDDPRAYTDHKGRKVAEPGRDKPPHDPVVPPPVEAQAPGTNKFEESEETQEKQPRESGEAQTYNQGHSGEHDEDSESQSSTETEDAPTTISTTTNGTSNASSNSNGNKADKATKKANKRTDERQQRGLMQWKPARNVAFAKDEAKYALRKVGKKFTGDLAGREPDVETET